MFKYRQGKRYKRAMVKKKIGVGILLSALFILMVSGVLALSITLNHPTSSEVLTNATVRISSTCATNGAFENASAANWTITCDVTEFLENDTINSTEGRYTSNFTTTKCASSASVTIVARCENNSGNSVNTSVTFTIDNDAPTTTLDVRPSIINKGKTVTLDGSRSTDLTAQTYSHVIQKPSNGGNSSAKTDQVSKFFGSDVNVKGTYTAFLTVTDLANFSTTTTVDFRVTSEDEDTSTAPPASSTKAGIQQSALGRTGLPPAFWYAVAFLVMTVFVVLGIIIYSKSR